MGKYKITNWQEYNASLINRGDISIWFEEETISNWYNKVGNGKRGRNFEYSDTCIELILTLRSLYHMPLRGIQGFMRGLFNLCEIDLVVPNYSTLSRRAGVIDISINKLPKKVSDIVVDSTGLKIYGEGEWKMRIHGKCKRRTWRKLHIGVCAETQMIIAHKLTEATVGDDSVMPFLLSNLKEANNVYADGAYISTTTFDSIVKIGAKGVIPLRGGTSIVQNNPSDGELDRNRLVKEIAEAGGRSQWKKTSGYHKRSLVETQMYRIKTIFGHTLANRKLSTQKTEASIRLKSLNRMTAMGMPLSVPC